MEKKKKMAIYFANFNGSFVLTNPDIVKIFNPERKQIDVLITEEDWKWNNSFISKWETMIYTKEKQRKEQIIKILKNNSTKYSLVNSDLKKEHQIFTIKINNMMVSQNSLPKNKNVSILNYKIFENEFEVTIFDLGKNLLSISKTG